MQPRMIFILIAFGLSGAAALIYEVAWSRALSLVLGSTTYALSTMLSTFMAGLALGGYLGGKLADKRSDVITLFGLCEAGIGISGLLSVPLISALPPLYFYFYKTFHLSPALFLSLQFILCAAVMLIPATFMGMTFPLVSRSLTPDLDQMGRRVGNAYAANTFGAILGSFFAGFFLLPWFGIKATTFIAGAVNLFVSLVLLLRFSGRKTAAFWAAFLFILSAAISASSRESATFITFYTMQRFPETLSFDQLSGWKQKGSRELYHRELPEGSVRLYRDNENFLILQTGAKIEGTTKGDMENTLLLAYLPIAAHSHPRDMLVVGLGTGVTLQAAKEHVPNVDVVEINPGVKEALLLHGPSGLFDGVRVISDDARRHLFLSERQYDIISSEPSYPAEASIANLFTREYYLLALDRLRPGGVYCQWLPYYFLKNEDMTMMIKTFGSVFSYVYVFKVGESLDRLMIGSDQPFVLDGEGIGKKAGKLNSTPYRLDPVVSRDPVQVEEIVRMQDIPMNTDDKPLLEFRTTKNIITGIQE